MSVFLSNKTKHIVWIVVIKSPMKMKLQKFLWITFQFLIFVKLESVRKLFQREPQSEPTEILQKAKKKQQQQKKGGLLFFLLPSRKLFISVTFWVKINK